MRFLSMADHLYRLFAKCCGNGQRREEYERESCESCENCGTQRQHVSAFIENKLEMRNKKQYQKKREGEEFYTNDA